MRYAFFEPAHAPGVTVLAERLEWPSLTDAATVTRAFTAPGVSAAVALDGAAVVGFAQAVGDGCLQSHLSFLAVAEEHRRRGIARELVAMVFAATGTARMDLITDEAEAFYASLPHRRMAGFRIYPGASGA